MLGYTQVHDFQGINHWIYGRIYDPTLHPDPAISTGDFLQHIFRNFVVDILAQTISLSRVTGVKEYQIFLFDDADEIDPENAVATIAIPRPHNHTAGSLTHEVDILDVSELFDAMSEDGEYFFRIQAISQRYEVRGQEGLYWGADSPISQPAREVDPLAGADSWALEGDPNLADAIAAGLISTRMFGNWTHEPTRLEAAENIVTFALVYTGIANVSDLYNHFALLQVEPWDDTDDSNARFLKAAGISDGIGGNNFGPTGTFTRAQMVVMLYRFIVDFLDINIGQHPMGSEFFDDVPDWNRADEALGWAYYVGIIDGVGYRVFDPDAALQNQHVGLFAIRALNNLPPF